MFSFSVVFFPERKKGKKKSRLLYLVSPEPFPYLFLWETDQENGKHLSIYLSPGEKGLVPVVPIMLEEIWHYYVYTMIFCHLLN